MAQHGADSNRLPYIDGVRALAAIQVVGYHLFMVNNARMMNLGQELVGPLAAFVKLMSYGVFNWGHYSVCVFMAVSGYVIALRPAPASRGEILGWIWRRLKRLTPPYWAALAVALVLGRVTLAVLGLGRWASLAMPPWEVIATHVVLVANLIRDHCGAIVPPLWYVGIQAQAYVVYALILAPVRRTWGLLAMLGTAALVGLGPHVVLPFGTNLDWTCPWMVIPFALGVAAAEVRGDHPAKVRRLWWWFAILATALGVALIGVQRRSWIESSWAASIWLPTLIKWPSDVIVGLAAAAWLAVWYTTPAPSKAMRLLTWRPLVWLGAMSYSLYLMHDTMVGLVNAVLWRSAIRPDVATIVLMTAGPALTLAAGLVLWATLERRRPAS